MLQHYILYILKNSNIRFDFALQLANELEIDVNKICTVSPFSDAIIEEIHLTLPDGLNGALDGNRIKVYLKNSLYPLMYLFGKNSMPDVDNLLTSFYQLNDEARKEVVETIQFKLQYHKDKERAEQVKQIKGGVKNSASESNIFTCTYLISYPLNVFLTLSTLSKILLIYIPLFPDHILMVCIHPSQIEPSYVLHA